MQTQKIKLEIWNERMLELCHWCINNHKATGEVDWLKQIKFGAYQNHTKIKAGKLSYKHKHMVQAAKNWSISMNWIYGFTNNMFRNDIGKQPVAQLEEVLRNLKQQKEYSQALT